MRYAKKVRSVNTIQHVYSHDLPSTSVASVLYILFTQS